MPDLTYYGLTFEERGSPTIIVVPSSNQPLPPPQVGQSVSVSGGTGAFVSGTVTELEYQLTFSSGAAGTSRTLTYNAIVG